eukprot:TRINITY_DN55687_c0_g1_i1.p1 TRINITY_DN55687_c0_g1~~TRINITY_DN55687_c0_g1_i1.p1  ORF type:complete len:567 (-),score=90.53 TRINITY_DN55687_c0_g1_i1:8-1708(-)
MGGGRRDRARRGKKPAEESLPAPLQPGLQCNAASAKTPGGKQTYLAKLIRSVNKQVLEAKLPQWFIDGPTDASARQAAKWRPGKNFRDWSNISGSALLLAMLQPNLYGIKNAKSVSHAFAADRDWHLRMLTFISPNKQTSSIGINNRRTNVIEGLLNYFADQPEHASLHEDLHRAWQLMTRALWLVDPRFELLHDEQTKQALLLQERIEDDEWWTSKEQALTDEAARRCSEEAREEAAASRKLAEQTEPAALDGALVVLSSATSDLAPGQFVQSRQPGDGADIDANLSYLVVRDLRLPEAIGYTTLLLLSTKLPAWFLNGPTYKSVQKAAAQDGCHIDVPGWTHATASALALAMMDPAKYDIIGPPLFLAVCESERGACTEKWSFIADSHQSASTTNRSYLVWALLAYCKSNGAHSVAAALERSLELMCRSLRVIDPHGELTHSQQVKRAVACETPVEDDAHWSKLEPGLVLKYKQGWREDADDWMSEECDRLFQLMSPHLKAFADGLEPGGEISGLTYNLMRSWLPGEGFSSTKKGASSMMKRLWGRAEAQLFDWGFRTPGASDP